ncbi:MAG: protein kinase [Cyanobacteria bacterium J06600_6]
MIGEILKDRYRITSILGSGRCGQTYLAEDTTSETPVSCAVKQFEPEAQDPLSLRKAKYLFAREVKILKILGNSDRIPSLLNFFRLDNKFYLVHEYVDGTDLSEELGDRQWQPAEVLSLLREILEIVEVPHHEKVIHQDIKPSNIIRRKSDGVLMLIDFGSIKKIHNQMANSDDSTCISVPIGTLGYMSPEQKSIKPRLASDIYAVGMICLYALTAVEPEDIALDPETETVKWQNLVQLKPEFAGVIESMVSPDLKRRYSSASEALAKVRKLKVGDKSLSFKTIAGAGALLLGISAAGFYYWQLERSLNQTPEVNLFEADRTQFPLVYRHDNYDISIKYPPSWKQTLSQPESKAESKAIAKFTPEQDDSFLIVPEVKVEVSPSESASLERYTTDYVYQITQLPKAKIIDSRPVELDESDGHKIVYTTVDPDSGIEKKHLQTWTLKDDLVYNITYQAAISDYPNFIEDVEQDMIKSVQIDSEKLTEG